MNIRDSQTEIITDWRPYAPYFNPATDKRLACSHTGGIKMRKGFMDRLLQMRKDLGFGFIVTSAYRSPSHPAEAKKAKGGAHTLGVSIDIHCTQTQAYLIVAAALYYGFKAVGVSQKGDFNGRFIHLDSATEEDDMPRPKFDDDSTITFYSY